MVSIVRMKDNEAKVFCGNDLQECVRLAYEDYSMQMDKYYEHGATSPCDNFNERLSLEKFQDAIMSHGQAGWMTTGSNGSFNYQVAQIEGVNIANPQEQLDKHMKHYEALGFDEAQLNEIRKGIQHGLPVEQITFLANKQFNGNQMAEIRQGLENGLDMEKIQFYANAEFNEWQMPFIRIGFEEGISLADMQENVTPEMPCFGISEFCISCIEEMEQDMGGIE